MGLKITFDAEKAKELAAKIKEIKESAQEKRNLAQKNFDDFYKTDKGNAWYKDSAATKEQRKILLKI